MCDCLLFDKENVFCKTVQKLTGYTGRAKIRKTTLSPTNTRTKVSLAVKRKRGGNTKTKTKNVERPKTKTQTNSEDVRRLITPFRRLSLATGE